MAIAIKKIKIWFVYANDHKQIENIFWSMIILRAVSRAIVKCV